MSLLSPRRRRRQPAGTPAGGQYAPDTRGATSIPAPAHTAPQPPSQPSEDTILASMRSAPAGTPLNAAYKAYLLKKDELAGPAALTWFNGSGSNLTPQATTAYTLVTAQRRRGKLAETAERVLGDMFGPQVLHGYQLINELTTTAVCTRHGDNYGDTNDWALTVRRGNGGTYSFWRTTGVCGTIYDYHAAYKVFGNPEIVNDIYTAEELDDIKAFFHAWVVPDAVPQMFKE